MAGINRLYLDTNVLIALAEGEDDLSASLKQLVSRFSASEAVLCTSELSLAELIVRPYREQHETLAKFYEDWLTSDGPFRILSVNRTILLGAASIRAQYPSIRLPDAIHLSTAFVDGCSHVLTGDRGIPDRLEINLRPRASETDARTLLMLRPDPATISSIIESQADT